MRKDDEVRERSWLEVEYRVELDIRGERVVPHGYALETGDPELNHAWQLACAPEAAREMLGHTKHLTAKGYISSDMGAALGAIGVRTVKLPPAIAHVIGDFGTIPVPIGDYRANIEHYQDRVQPPPPPMHSGGA